MGPSINESRFKDKKDVRYALEEHGLITDQNFNVCGFSAASSLSTKDKIITEMSSVMKKLLDALDRGDASEVISELRGEAEAIMIFSRYHEKGAVEKSPDSSPALNGVAFIKETLRKKAEAAKEAAEEKARRDEYLSKRMLESGVEASRATGMNIEELYQFFDPNRQEKTQGQTQPHKRPRPGVLGQRVIAMVPKGPRGNLQ